MNNFGKTTQQRQPVQLKNTCPRKLMLAVNEILLLEDFLVVMKS